MDTTPSVTFADESPRPSDHPTEVTVEPSPADKAADTRKPLLLDDNNPELYRGLLLLVYHSDMFNCKPIIDVTMHILIVLQTRT